MMMNIRNENDLKKQFDKNEFVLLKNTIDIDSINLMKNEALGLKVNSFKIKFWLVTNYL